MTGPEHQPRKPVILTVDDDPAVSRAVARDLRRHYGDKHRIVRAESGPDALETLLDDQVRFLEGWFCDTLPSAPIDRLAVLRLDGDLYQSTMDALVALEPKVSPGGYVIVDDYGGWASCRAAVDDYRAARGIDAPIRTVDWTGAWWQVPPT